jgi:hypothetical protein
MKRHINILALIAGSAIALTGAGFAQTQAAKAPAAKQEKAATTTTRGVVKSMDANQIVIERSSKSGPKDITLMMNSDTQKEGDLKVGSPVTVHYRYDNKKDMATSVHVDAAKKPASKGGK